MKKNITEANRYLADANKLLKENCKVDKYGHYSDEKYVKKAGRTAWRGVLKALDPLHPKLSKGQRKDVDTYKKIFKGRGNIAGVYNNTYQELNLSMGYDGVTNAELKKAAWENAKTLIDWANKNT